MEFELRDRAVHLPAADTLICADLHVGRAASSDVTVDIGEREDLVERFESILSQYRPAETVIAGDLLHSFNTLPTGTMETIHEIQRVASEANSSLVVTPGNHDTMLEECWDGVSTAEYHLDGTNAVALHGHCPPETDAGCYVIGHDHPTIEIEGKRHPCYLYGPAVYGDADVLMLPSFSRLPAGVAVNEMYGRDFQSPLVDDADAFRPIVRDEAADETHEFPPLRELRQLL